MSAPNSETNSKHDHINGYGTKTNNVTCTVISNTSTNEGDATTTENESVTIATSTEDDNNAADDATTNVTISLVNRSLSNSITDIVSPSSPSNGVASVNGASTTTVNCNNTITSTCTIGRNGLIVQELDEVSQGDVAAAQSPVLLPYHHHNLHHHHHPTLTPPTSPPSMENGSVQYHRHGDDKENRHCTLLAMNGYHQNGAGNDAQLFPDAPTTPKVLRKVAPMYCNFKKVTAGATSTTPNHNAEDVTNGHHDEGGESPRNGGVTVTVTINGDDRHASTTRIHICPPD